MFREDLSLLVFDLDGTLIDSSEDLCASLNAALQDAGLSSLSQEQVATFVGDGAAALVGRALAFKLTETEAKLPASLVQRCLGFFLSHYHVHKLDRTRPYPGVLESLQMIRRELPGLPMAILTNKPVRPSREICEALGLSPYFFANYGGDSFPTKKPNPEGLQTILREAHRIRGAQDGSGGSNGVAGAVMIGDSPVDIEVGRACGFRTIGCAYGLAPAALAVSGPDILIHTPGELPSALGLN